MADQQIEIKMTVDNSKEVLAQLEEAIDRALTSAAMQVNNFAVLEFDRNPRRIDTGLLKNSITYGLGGSSAAVPTYKADNESRFGPKGVIPSGSYSGSLPNDREGDRTAHIGTNVEYAIYVHEGANLPGGGYMEPNRFLKNAVERNKSVIQKIIEHFLRGGS